MRFFWAIFLTLTSFGSSAKLDCSVPLVDINSDFLVKKLTSVDEDSQEPTERQFIVYDTGDIAVVHQKTCVMSNIQIEYFYNSRHYPDIADNFLNIFNQIKSEHHLKVNEDMFVSLIDILKSESFSSDKIIIKSPTDFVEYDFSIQTDDSYFGLYTKKLSFYISIGGI
ncbi:hypothetical protein [Vibrio ouci]|uniref:Uncharacterized protein n=1 Tax=Vibrio ouci TaxID=2499078 RepID=A0A4Y8W9E2_9VIBR|nr:hypothetical protein [Vibrio ouci]TFH89539.1 hypothetical protein ELS82_21630 [Vibrio ouci]